VLLGNVPNDICAPKKLLKSNMGISSSNITTQQHNNTTTQQHNNTTTQQHNNTTTQQHNNTTTQQHNHTTTQQHNNTTTQQHNNTTTQQHNNTTTQQHNNQGGVVVITRRPRKPQAMWQRWRPHPRCRPQKLWMDVLWDSKDRRDRVRQCSKT
jgi:hypothetical protein